MQLMVAEIWPAQDFEIKDHRVKVKLKGHTEFSNDVAQLDPLRNIPAKFELPAINGCRDILLSRQDSWTDKNGENTPGFKYF